MLAQSNIAVMYDNGDAVAEDDVEAVRWFTLSAEGGFPPGQYNLADMYAQGKGVEQNFVLAVRWFQAAARQGLPEAQMSLMQAYYYGDGVPRDHGVAYMWLMIAAEAGDAEAVGDRAAFESRISKSAVARGREMAMKCISIGLATCP